MDDKPRHNSSIALIYALIGLTLLVLSLSIYETRTRYSKITIAGQTFSSWRIDRIRKQNLKSIPSNEISNIEREIVIIKAGINSSHKDFATRLEQTKKQFLALQGLLKAGNHDSIESIPSRTTNTNLEIWKTVILESIDKIKKKSNIPNKFGLKTKHTDLLGAVNALIKINQTFLSAKVQLDKEQNELATKSAINILTQILGQKDYNKATINDKARLLDLVDELSSYTAGNYVSNFLIFIPRELLIFIVVLSSGIIGRSLHIFSLSRSVNGPDQRPISWTDPLFGAMVAVSLYILFRAGVLLANDTRLSGVSDPGLNPFFVAFVGLIAGLLAERVVERLQSSAESWLPSINGPKTPRYARKLSQLMNEKGLVPADWEKHFPEDRQQLPGWMMEEIPVPPSRQKVMALWLGVPIRELFTDIPPSARPDAAKEGPDTPREG